MRPDPYRATGRTTRMLLQVLSVPEGKVLVVCAHTNTATLFARRLLEIAKFLDIPADKELKRDNVITIGEKEITLVGARERSRGVKYKTTILDHAAHLEGGNHYVP